MRLENRDVEALLRTGNVKRFAATLHRLVAPKMSFSGAGVVPFGVASRDPENIAMRFANSWIGPEALSKAWSLLPDPRENNALFFRGARRCCNIYEDALRTNVADTPYFREFAELYDFSQSLGAGIGTLGDPVAVLTFGRSAKARLFDAQEHRLVAAMRDAVAGHVRALMGPLYATDRVADTATLIGQTAPRPLLLFDRRGGLLWLSDSARDRLGRGGRNTATAFSFGGDWQLLEALRECARRAAKRRLDGQAAARRTQTVLATDETLLLRSDSKHVMIEIATQARHAPPPSPGPAGLLTPTERRVAEMRAEGYSVANIAYVFGRSENTIKTHLKSVARRLRVSSPIEIFMALHGFDNSGGPTRG